jgi:DNA-binding PadR family transcriptional regulator
VSEPKLSHLQFVVLVLIQEGASSGKELRSALQDDGMRKSGPSFYQLMARLEDNGWVKGEYKQEVIDGQIIRERHYTLTPNGSRALQLSTSFYERWIHRFDAGAAPA